MRNSTWIRNVIRMITWIWILIKRCAILYWLVRAFLQELLRIRVSRAESHLTFLRNGPFVIIDCSRQNKSVKNGIMDVRLDFECKENMPANTTIYCFIIYNRVIQYNPLTNVVRKITFFRHSIKSIRIRPQSSAVFSTCSCQCSWICKDSSLIRNLSRRKWWCWNTRPFSHFYESRVIEIFDKIR